MTINDNLKKWRENRKAEGRGIKSQGSKGNIKKINKGVIKKE